MIALPPDPIVLSVITFPIGWFIALACTEAGHVAAHKWDKALFKLGNHFGSFLMGLAFVALVWRLPH
jgi:hypothetical protein